jgi:hypothetical protein
MKYKIIAMGLILVTALATCMGCTTQGSGDAAYEESDASNAKTASESITAVPAMDSAADSTSATPKDESSVDSSESDINSITPKDDIGLAAASNEPPADSSVASNAASESASIDESFYAIPIPDEIFAKMQGKSYKDNCTIPRDDLRYIHVLHKNIEGETLEGEMVCSKLIAEDLLEIFRELYEQSYPIEKMRLIDEYDANDELSMTDNNSSCFNYRTISHTNKISKHGLGVAVDINTLYNPYTKVVDGERIIEPAAGAPFLDRDADFPYKIERGDLCYNLFISHGFEWGGDWPDRKDYQHFEK